MQHYSTVLGLIIGLLHIRLTRWRIPTFVLILWFGLWLYRISLLFQVKKSDELEKILLDMRAERSCSKVSSKYRQKIRALVHDRVGAIDIDFSVYVAGVLHFQQPPPGIVLDKSLCAGLMWKKGHLHRNWSLRWFVFDLRERQFRYYTDSSMVEEKGSFMLADVTHVERVLDNKQYPYLINVGTKGRIYHFRTDNEAVLNIWLVAFDSISAPA